MELHYIHRQKNNYFMSANVFLGACDSTEYLVCLYLSPTTDRRSPSSKAVVIERKAEWGQKCFSRGIQPGWQVCPCHLLPISHLKRLPKSLSKGISPLGRERLCRLPLHSWGSLSECDNWYKRAEQEYGRSSGPSVEWSCQP